MAVVKLKSASLRPIYRTMRLRLAAFVLGLALLGASAVVAVRRHTDERLRVIDAATGRVVDDGALPATGATAGRYRVVTAPKDRWSRAFGPSGAATGGIGLLLLPFALSTSGPYDRPLRDGALADELTGLPNRALFRDRVRQAVLQTRRDGGLAAVLLLDLDRFKEVNETLGHEKGDQLLNDVAERLQETLRDADTVARFHGDEFAVLIPRLEE